MELDDRVQVGEGKRPSIDVLRLTGAMLILVGSAARADVVPDPLPDRYLTKLRFVAELEQPISATGKGIPLRSLMRRLSHDRQIAILLDRRVDPDLEVGMDGGDRPLRAGIEEIARLVKLGVSQVGNCLMIAPPDAAMRLRTLVALRQQELSRAGIAGSASPAYRQKSQRVTIAWKDLDRPADIIQTVLQRFGLRTENLKQIPHDLWAGGAIPEATAAEALSLVLNQFDLTFEWTNHGRGVRLVPIPSTVAIERSYALHGKSIGDVVAGLQTKVSGIDAELRGGQLVVRGTIEQHEAVAAALGGSRAQSRKAAPSTQPPAGFDRQSFSLRVQDVSLRALIDELKRQGIAIEYNAETLRAAGIDLDRKVSLDLPKLPVRQFLTRLLQPQGLTFHVEREIVVLEPIQPR